MAEEQKIALTIEIQGGERAINSMAELKKARKDLQNAFLQGDENAVKGLKKIDDALGDLQDTTKAVQGDGVEPLRNSFRLFTEGLTNFDFGKIGAAFKGLGAAMKAVPILLLVEGITYLIQNFEELSKGSGLLGKALRGIGAIIEGVKTVFYELGASIGLVNKELDSLNSKIEERSKVSSKFLQQQTAEIERQIKVAKAAGRETIELEIEKQEAIVITNRAIVKQIEAYVRAGGVMNEEQRKMLESSLEAIRNARTEEVVIAATAQKKINEVNKSAYEERMRLKSLEFEANKKFAEDEFQMQMDLLNALEAEKQAKAEAELDSQAAIDAEKLNMSLWRYETEKAQRDKDLQEKEAAEMKERQLRQETMQSYAETTKQGLQAAQALTDLFFNYQLKRAKGNEAEEKRIKKRAFQVNKAFGIANAVIDGVGAVQKALNNPYPLNIVLAVLSGVLAAANVAKIASTKFDDGGSSAGGGGDIQAGGGALAGASAPAINQPNNTVTQLNEDGVNEAKKQPTQKVVVVESDITEKQKTVAKIEETATI